MADEIGWEVFMVALACEPGGVSFTCAGAAKRDFSKRARRGVQLKLQKIVSKNRGPTPLACTSQDKCLRATALATELRHTRWTLDIEVR